MPLTQEQVDALKPGDLLRVVDVSRPSGSSCCDEAGCKQSGLYLHDVVEVVSQGSLDVQVRGRDGVARFWRQFRFEKVDPFQGPARVGDKVLAVTHWGDDCAGSVPAGSVVEVDFTNQYGHIGTRYAPSSWNPSGYYTSQLYKGRLHLVGIHTPLRLGGTPTANTSATVKPPQQKEDVMPEPNVNQAIKVYENLVASIRAENKALHDDNASLRAMAIEKDLLYGHAYQEATRVTRQLTHLQGQLSISDAFCMHLQDKLARANAKLMASESPLDKAANAVATSTVAAAKASGGFLGRAARAMGHGAKRTAMLPVSGAMAVGSFLARDWRKTYLIRSAAVALMLALFALSACLLYDDVVRWGPEREADGIMVPAPPAPNSQRERDWLEARQRRIDAAIQKGQITPVAVRNRRVS